MAPVNRVVRALAWPLGMAAFALVVGALLHPSAPFDDAAISFRYAARLADGHGLTYNDHEAVMGFSNPLYTLLLGGAALFGLPIEGTATVIGLLAFAASAGLATALGQRLSNLAGGLAAGAAIALLPVLRFNALAGLEVGLSAALGLAAVLAASQRRQVLAGVLLGLALFNKLDAALLCLAVGGAWLLVVRKPPWKMAAVAGAVIAPWLLGSWLYYGSPIPNSITSKLGDERRPFDHLWALKSTAASGGLLLLVPAVAYLAGAMPRRRPDDRMIAFALAGWWLLHLLSLAVVDLGDDFPWYLLVLYPPLVVLAGAGFGVGLAALGRWAWRRLRTPPSTRMPIDGMAGLALRFAVVVTAVLWVAGVRLDPWSWAVTVLVAAGAGALAALVGAHRLPDWLTGPVLAGALVVGLLGVATVIVDPVWTDLRTTEDPGPHGRFSDDLQAAGAFVGEHGEPGEVLATCFGRPAYEAEDLQVRDTCGLNQTEDPPEPDTWYIASGDPADHGANAPVEFPGFRVAARFTTACEAFPGWTWWEVFVREGSDADQRTPDPPPVPEVCLHGDD